MFKDSASRAVGWRLIVGKYDVPILHLIISRDSSQSDGQNIYDNNLTGQHYGHSSAAPSLERGKPGIIVVWRLPSETEDFERESWKRVKKKKKNKRKGVQFIPTDTHIRKNRLAFQVWLWSIYWCRSNLNTETAEGQTVFQLSNYGNIIILCLLSRKWQRHNNLTEDMKDYENSHTLRNKNKIACLW